MKRSTGQAPRTPVQIVALLGNPGSEYERTRHNVARGVADRLVSDSSAWKEKFHGRFAKVRDLIVLMPQTWMNESGRSVQAACRFFNVAPAELLVLSDDLESPFGALEIAYGGGHRGHNGIRSVAQALSGEPFRHLRIGIGRPPAAQQVSSWVLGRFTPDEEAQLPAILDLAAERVRAAAGWSTAGSAL